MSFEHILRRPEKDVWMHLYCFADSAQPTHTFTEVEQPIVLHKQRGLQ